MRDCLAVSISRLTCVRVFDRAEMSPKHLRRANEDHRREARGEYRAVPPPISRRLGKNRVRSPGTFLFGGQSVTTELESRSHAVVVLYNVIVSSVLPSPPRLSAVFVFTATAFRFADRAAHVRPVHGDGAAPRDHSQGGARRLGAAAAAAAAASVVVGALRRGQHNGSHQPLRSTHSYRKQVEKHRPLYNLEPSPNHRHSQK